MLIQTFGFVGNPDMPSFVRVELRVERGFLLRLSGVNTSAAKSLQTRVRSALIACGYRWPGKGITVNVAPAAETRSTTQLDLPIALAILAAEGKIPNHVINHTAISGELSLDGTIRITESHSSITRSVPINEQSQIKFLFSPSINSITHLSQLIGLLKKPRINSNKPIYNQLQFKRVVVAKDFKAKNTDEIKKKNHETTFFDLNGETNAKRKALIAAAGNHHTIIIGPPGSGKTVLAKCIHSLHPDINFSNTAGQSRPPWRAPHSSTKAAGLIGSWRQSGGVSGSIAHGEWSLADQGVLFMDEWPEF